MSSFQKVVKYGAITFAIVLAIGIITSIVSVAIGVFSFVTGNVGLGMKKGYVERFNESHKFDNVRSLDIDLSAGSLEILKGESFLIEANDVSKDFRMDLTNNGTLRIRERNRGFNFLWFNFNGNNRITTEIKVYIPEDYKLNSTTIDAGAGNLYIEGLNTKKFRISAGAGKIDGYNITAENASIDGGVGNINMENVIFNDMDLNSGVGKVFLEGVFKGDNEIDCGVGDLDMEIIGDVDDYDIKIDNGVGQVRLNGERISREYRKNNNRSNSLDVDGGVGSVDIIFKAN